MNSPRRLLLIPRTYQVLRILITAILCISAWHSALASEMQEESRIKFAIYSSAWGGNTQDDLRLVAHNTMTEAIQLDSIIFLKPQFPESEVELMLGMRVPATGYADLNIGYVNLLLDNKCINRTLSNKWRLAEISNYTLNPSVRNLIIEDTKSFRIYQCKESVQMRWTSLETDTNHVHEEWVLFHFESRSKP
ncbi:MAG: hypothetical protein OXD01_14595 [Gammaproteobacteria bacterium]|nr:hypothetical protein [Gammaproteobacteria bacterium]